MQHPLTPDSEIFDEVTDLATMDAESMTADDPPPLPERFARIKQKLIAGHEAAVTDSFRRLLRELRAETCRLAAADPNVVIPSIDFLDIQDPARGAAFAAALRRRGVAVIRRVVPPGVAAAWGEETREYIGQCPRRPSSADSGNGCPLAVPPGADPQTYDLFWSPGQVRARADSRVLAAQRFIMRAAWHSGSGSGSEGDGALISTNHPVSYADRFRICTPGEGGGLAPHIDGGSVERWEPDGYGRGGGAAGGGGGGGRDRGTYGRIFEGRWEDHDPWDATARLGATSDLYNSADACSITRLFQGWLALGGGEEPAAAAPLRVCPMLRLATAYVLLRPFFAPVRPASAFVRGGGGKGGPGSDYDYDYDFADGDDDDEEEDGFLRASNWTLRHPRPDSALPGALPGRGALAVSDATHPHLRLRRTLAALPRVGPGDYVVWHPDLVHATATATATSAADFDGGYKFGAGFSEPGSGSLYLYVPACPLTATNALYLARQRRAFLLGLPAPDFAGGGGIGRGGGKDDSNNNSSGGSSYFGGGGGVESTHLGRPGVQDVNDAGGEEGLRAMGLLAFEERGLGAGMGMGLGLGVGDGVLPPSRVERDVVGLANGILFPDRFDMCYKRKRGAKDV